MSHPVVRGSDRLRRPPCGKEGIGREFIVRAFASLAQFEGQRAFDRDGDPVREVESRAASLGSRGCAPDPRDEQARQQAQDDEQGTASHSFCIYNMAVAHPIWFTAR